MIIAIVSLKQYFGSMRLQNNMSETTQAIAELVIVISGYKTTRKEDQLNQFQQSSWVDIIESYLAK